MPESLRLIAVEGLPAVRPGDPLADLIVNACAAQGTPLERGDVLVVAQKVVSKAENRAVDLRKVKPSAFSEQYAATYEKDARMIEIVLRETKRVSRMDRGVLICETHHGFTCANAGVDRSNIAEHDTVLLLPEDPQASATALRERAEKLAGANLAVLITDTWGRPLRAGLSEFCIGLSGLRAIQDYVGKQDYFGRQLEFTAVAVADELAAAAGLLMRKDAGVPAVIVRGFQYRRATRATAHELLRDPKEDLFR